jgi:hypothetical protein
MELSADTGLSLYVYSPEPGTPSDDAIRLLASWAATNQQLAKTESAHATDGRRDPRRLTTAQPSG